MARFNRGGNTMTPQRGGRGGFQRGGTPSKFNRGGRQDMQSRGGGQFSPRGRGGFRGGRGFGGGRGGDRGGRGGGFGRGRGQFNRGGFQGNKNFAREDKQKHDSEEENESEVESDEEATKPKAKSTPAKGILKKNGQKPAASSDEEDEEEDLDDEDMDDEDLSDEDEEETSPEDESIEATPSKPQAKNVKKQKKASESEDEDINEEGEDEEEESSADETPSKGKKVVAPSTSSKAVAKTAEKTSQKKDIAKPAIATPSKQQAEDVKKQQKVSKSEDEDEDMDEDEEEEEESSTDETPSKGKETLAPVANGKAGLKTTEKTSQKKDVVKKAVEEDEEEEDEDEEDEDEEEEDEDEEEEEDEDEEEEEEDEEQKVEVPSKVKQAPKALSATPSKQQKPQIKPQESKKRTTSETSDVAQPAKKAKPSVIGEPADKKIFTEELARKKTRDASTLFVKNLPKNISDKEIMALSADIKDFRRRTKKCRFGWLVFANEETCEKNYEKLKNATLGGSAFEIDYVGVKSKHTQAQSKGVAVPTINPLELYIGELVQPTSVEELKTAFPTAKNFTIPKVKPGSLKKNFAFVAFSTPQEARAAFDKSKNLKLGGVEVVVAYARIKNAAGQ